MNVRKLVGRVMVGVVAGVLSLCVAQLDFDAVRLWILSVRAQEAEVLVIDQDTVWSKGETLTFDRKVLVDSGVTLRIEPGANIRLNGGDLTIWGSLLAEGTKEEPIVFASENNAPFSIGFQGDVEVMESVMRFVEIRGGGEYRVLPPSSCDMTLVPRWFQSAWAADDCFRGFSALFYSGGKLRIENTTFIDNHYADIYAYLSVEDGGSEEFLKVQASHFGSNTQGTAVIADVDCSVVELPKETCGERMMFTDNWWGDASGPNYHTGSQDWFEQSNSTGIGQTIVGDIVRFRPWLSAPSGSETGCVERCFSNVLFLPGIKASRLYQEGAMGTEDKLWLPNYFGNDLEELALDEDGKSVNEVYTKDVMDEAVLPGSAGINLYKSFLERLEALKVQGDINDYQAFAYDWRKSVDDIVREGTLYPDGVVRSLAADAESLAHSSKNGKIIIVAHSNGGLLAKALMMELESTGRTDVAEKVVFVGTPQMGTPLSLLSLLYGYDESLLAGTLISRGDARALAEYMPGVYGLLPSETYFDRVDDPFMAFSSEHTRYQEFTQSYGEEINDFEELRAFLSATGDGRSKPSKDNVEFENVLGQRFIDQAKETHRRLDAWVPPAGVDAIQIAGWGLDTVSGVEYTEKEKTACSFSSGARWSCQGTGEYEPLYEPKFTVDGDEVVVAPSALMLSEASNMKRYWVDLYGYNDQSIFNGKHKNLLEVNSVQQFIETMITDSNGVDLLPEFIETSRPSDYVDAQSRLRMSLYSPLDIHLYDSAGRHTGPKTVVVDGQEQIVFEEHIPNSYYRQFGERKYVGFPRESGIRIEMDGLAEGSYTLRLEEVRATADGEERVSDATFKDFPVTADTNVSVTVPSSGLIDPVNLVSDVDGDGDTDMSVESVPGGIVTPDNTAPESVMHLDGKSGKNGWYTGDVTVSFTADDGDGSGVESIAYSLDEGVTWMQYSEPMVFSHEGVMSIRYFATDKQGNAEQPQMATIKRDTIAPEATIGFNVLTHRLDILGYDILSSVVSSSAVRGMKKTVTLADESGHETILTVVSKRDREGRLEGVVESIVYDGIKQPLHETGFQYAWRTYGKNEKYFRFASRLRTSSEDMETRYVPIQDTTFVMRKPENIDDEEEDDDRPIREVLPGMVVPFLQTKTGNVTIHLEHEN